MGRGRWFELLLPVARTVGAVGAPVPGTVPVAPVSVHPAPPLVLVVEDDPTLRRLLSMLLTDEGFAVATAADGAEALAILARGLTPAIALVDLAMPVLDGREFLARARANGYRFPALLVSASPEAEQVAEEVGCQAVVPKPYDFGQLLARMRELLPGAPLPPGNFGRPPSLRAESRRAATERTHR